MSEGIKKVVDTILLCDEPTDFVEFPLPLEGIHKIERVIEYLSLLLYRYKDYLLSEFVKEVVVGGWEGYLTRKVLSPEFSVFPLPSLVRVLSRRRRITQSRKDKLELLRRIWRRVISPPPRLVFVFPFKVYKDGEFYVCGTTFTVRRTDLSFLLETVGGRVLSLYLQGQQIKEIEIPTKGEFVGEGVVLVFSNPRHAIVTFSSTSARR